MMPRDFAGLTAASILPTRTFQLAARVMDDLVANSAVGVLYGPAGTGKTFAMEAALERQASRNPELAITTLSFTCVRKPDQSWRQGAVGSRDEFAGCGGCKRSRCACGVSGGRCL